MIEWLLRTWQPAGELSFLNVGGYVTVRAGAALLLAFVLSVLFGPRTIAWLRAKKIGQHIRKVTGENSVDLHEMHAGKAGTPTMGGILMMGSLLAAVALFGDWRSPLLQIAVAMTIGYGAIGFVDDYRKLTGQNSKGLSGRAKLLWQGLLGIAFALLFMQAGDAVYYKHLANSGAEWLYVPFFKDAAFNLGLLYVPFAMIVLMGTSNAVNLTDGLDGLAAGVAAVSALCFAVVAYAVGRVDFADYLFVARIAGGGEVAVLLSALVGASIGFLWFNSHPAQVFMGDTGSMMIGGALGAAALLLKQELLLVLIGGVFVAEAGSVLLQVGSMKLRKKRIFLMSPLHHHFERAGIPESKIIIRFWVVSLLLGLAGLSTLKLR